MTAADLPSLELMDSPGPAHDVWASAAVHESFRPGDLLDEWLSNHVDAPAEHKRLAIRSTLDLQSSGMKSTDAKGRATFQLSPQRRLDVLKRIGIDAALNALSAIDESSRTLTERVFGSLIAGEPIALDKDDRLHLLALHAAIPWAAAVGAKVPFEPRDIERHLGRLDFLRAVGGSDLHRFIGRDDLRRRLDKWYHRDMPVPQPLLIEGPGGIGKSMAVGRFIADVLESDITERRPCAVFHIDFDRLSLQQARPTTILQEIAKQAAQWWIVERSEELLSLRRELGSGSAGVEGIAHVSRSIEATRSGQVLARRLVNLLSVKHRQRRIIIFVDSFEQVEAFNYNAAYSPRRVINLLTEAGAQVFSIYASRVFVQPKALSNKLPPFVLHQFSVREAEAYLQNEAARAGFEILQRTAKRVHETIGRSPLTLRLAVGLLEKETGNHHFDPTTWGDLAQNSPELVQAVLYDRILRRIQNPELRKIARPGLLVRRLTEDVIIKVLATPCALDLSVTPPAQLMEEARREGQLFLADASDPGALRHRQDVRAMMLANLESTIPLAVAQAINERAVAYYSNQGDSLIPRTEELYHRLRLNQASEVLDSRWSHKAGQTLRPVLRELPPNARTYVRYKLGVAAPGVVADSVPVLRQNAEAKGGDDAQWREYRLMMLREVQSNGLSGGLADRLQQQNADRLDGPLGDVYAQLLLWEGRLEELLNQARRLLSRPSGHYDKAVFASVLATVAGALEGQHHLREAQTYWLRASRIAKGLADQLDELGPLIGTIRTRRKLGTTPDRRRTEFKRAISIVGSLRRELYDRRVQAREAAAELSEILVDGKVGYEHDSVRRLVAFVLEVSEAFPSAVDDPARLQALSNRLVGTRRLLSLRELNDAVSKLLYRDSERLQLLVRALRDEVDWSLSRPLSKSNTQHYV